MSVEFGTAIGLGGTNARVGTIEHHADGDNLSIFRSEPTPQQPNEFFKWMARQVLEAADSGHSWVVAGIPGPVDSDGRRIGPVVNVPGLAHSRLDVRDCLTAADPAAGRLLTQDDDSLRFHIVNDGDLAAHAAATRVGQNAYDTVAALIIGTGVGTGVVRKDKNGIYRTTGLPLEIGHVPIDMDPTETNESTISGPALKARYGTEARELPAGHPAWATVAVTVGRMASTLGLMLDVNLVVPCGGVGAGSYGKYSRLMNGEINRFIGGGNAVQKSHLPDIIPVPAKDAQTFELYGASGVVAAHA